MDRNNLNEKIIEGFFRISRVLRQQMNISSRIAHLSILQLEILIYLKNNAKTQMGNIADYFLVSRPTISTHLDCLETMKLITKKTDRKDKRIDHVLLTKKGNLLLEEGLRQKNKRMNVLLTYLPQKDKKSLLTIITNLRATIERSYDNQT